MLKEIQKNLPWNDLGVDIVLECTGAFRDYEGAIKHVHSGAKKVLISAPAKGDMKTIVYNVNHDILTGEEEVVSAASCTTNCLAPVVDALDKAYGVKSGVLTTVHAYTNDQTTLDTKHKDLRRGRAAAANIVPTSTGAAKAVGLVLPHLKGKLDGFALRVPVVTGSLVDVVLDLGKNVTVEDVNSTLKNAVSETLGYTSSPIVSSDIIGLKNGALVDSSLTMLVDVDGKQMVKVIAWYDNEMSYTAQLIRTMKYLVGLKK